MLHYDVGVNGQRLRIFDVNKTPEDNFNNEKFNTTDLAVPGVLPVKEPAGVIVYKTASDTVDVTVEDTAQEPALSLTASDTLNVEEIFDNPPFVGDPWQMVRGQVEAYHDRTESTNASTTDASSYTGYYESVESVDVSTAEVVTATDADLTATESLDAEITEKLGDRDLTLAEDIAATVDETAEVSEPPVYFTAEDTVDVSTQEDGAYEVYVEDGDSITVEAVEELTDLSLEVEDLAAVAVTEEADVDRTIELTAEDTLTIAEDLAETVRVVEYQDADRVIKDLDYKVIDLPYNFAAEDKAANIVCMVLDTGITTATLGTAYEMVVLPDNFRGEGL